VARNRKRAKERRARRPAAAPASRPGVATARGQREERGERSEREERGEPSEREELPRHEDLPGPLEHAAPDVELADAQLAVGRPELDAEDELDQDYVADEGAGDFDGGGRDGPPDEASGGGELAPVGPASAPAHRRVPGNRLINFLQGSWRELQRVQWPDRRQVMQATGVVIGFVIVAGLFLGAADWVAGKVVTFILK
jgi:preprotein translocase SecE subunit